MTWTFIWLMVILKIPILGLFGIVYWAVKRTEEPSDPQEVRPLAPPRPAPHPPSKARRPRRPRSPHGDPMPLPPPRVRPVRAVGREHADR